MSTDKAADAMFGVGLIGLGGINASTSWGYHLAETSRRSLLLLTTWRQ